MPEHRRVLGAARGHVPDPRREVHTALRLLRRDDGTPRSGRRGRARADRGDGPVDGTALRRAHRRRARRPARRRRTDLGCRDPRVPRRRPRHRGRGAPIRLQGRRRRSRNGARRRAGRVRPQPRDRPAAPRPDPAGVRLRPLPRRAAVRGTLPGGAGHEVEPDPRHGRARRRGGARRCATSARRAPTSSRSASTSSRRRTTSRWIGGCTPRSSPRSRGWARRNWGSRASRRGRSSDPAITRANSSGALARTVGVSAASPGGR